MPLKRFFFIIFIAVSPCFLSGNNYQSSNQNASGPNNDIIDTTYIKLLINRGEENDENDYNIANSYFQQAFDLISEYQSQKLDKAFSEKLKYLEIDALHGLAYTNLQIGNVDLALELYKSLIPLWEETDFIDKHVNSYIHIGNIYFHQSKYPEALEAYSDGLVLAEEAGLTQRIANHSLNIGNVYYYMSDYAKSLEYFQKAINTYQQMDSSINAAYAYLGMGNVFADMGMIDNALENYKKSLQISESLNVTRNTEEVYLSIGSIYYDSNDLKKAHEYYLLALEMAEENNNTYTLAKCFENIGIIHAANQEYEKAIQNYNRALDIAKSNSFNLITVSTYHNKSLSLMRMGNTDQALTIALESLNLSRELSMLSQETETYRVIAEIYKTQQNFKMALSYFENYKAYNDSLFNLEKQRQINEIDAKFQLTQKQQEIDFQNLELEKNKTEIERKNLIVNIFIIVIVFIIILAFSYVWYYNQKKMTNRQIKRYLKNISNLSKNNLNLEKDLSNQKQLIDELKKSQNILLQNEKDNLDFAIRLNDELTSGKDSMKVIFPGRYFIYCKDFANTDLCFAHKTPDYALIAVADILHDSFKKVLFNLSMNHYLKGRMNDSFFQSLTTGFNDLADFLEHKINTQITNQKQRIVSGIAMVFIDYSNYKVRFISKNIPFYFAIARNNESIFKPLCDYQEIQQPALILDSMSQADNEKSSQTRDYEIKLKKQDRIYLINTSALDFEKNNYHLRESLDSFIIRFLDTNQNMEIDQQGEYLSQQFNRKNQTDPGLYPTNFTVRGFEL